MRKWEAEKKLKYHENKPLGHCPVINGPCRLDCVSYIPARVTGTDSLSYFHKEYCMSPLVTGYCETQ